MPALLNRASGVNVSLKMHTRSVHKFMTFVNESATTMPLGVIAAYENLMNNLDNLLSELKSSTEYTNDAVTHFCELILHLIDETSSIYRDIKKSHETRSSNNETIVKDPTTEMISDISYLAESQYTVQTRASMHSQRRLYNKPR